MHKNEAKVSIESQIDPFALFTCKTTDITAISIKAITAFLVYMEENVRTFCICQLPNNLAQDYEWVLLKQNGDHLVQI